MMSPDAETLIDARDLRVHFRQSRLLGGKGSTIAAVDGIDLAIRRGETLGLVGESGCGKSTLGRAILWLEKVTTGTVRFAGEDLSRLRPAELRRMRRNMQMILQDPYGSLNPKLTVAEILAEPITTHAIASGAGIAKAIDELLEVVSLDPKRRDQYPSEFSGGQRQRIGIARALAVRPQFLVCDEATSALDVSVRAQVLNLLAQLRQRYRLTYLFISHDLAVVCHMSDRIGVMYLGKLVEIGPTGSINQSPAHPYTHALLSAVPVPDPEVERARQRIVLRGDLPSPSAPPRGCRFWTRCWLAERLGKPDLCRDQEPPLREIGPDHLSACHFAEQAMSERTGAIASVRHAPRRIEVVADRLPGATSAPESG